MAEFRTLRAERQAARQQALEEAQLLAQLAYSKGEKYDPARDFPPELLQIGSDFSSAGISRLIARNQRLSEARHCAKTQWGGPMARLLAQESQPPHNSRCGARTIACSVHNR